MAKNQQDFANKKVSYLKVTEAAIAAIKQKISAKDDCFGIKIAIKTRGCSGMAYNIEYATTNIVTEYDELVELEQVNIFIDPKISLFLFNTELDFVEKKTEGGLVVESGFVFNNPNEAGRCGCGESFYV
jgi:iron-sulfur cluster assembly accessory protein